MKTQQKDKIQYIDQFRKISTLQKLPTLTFKLQNIFEDEQQKQNNNFIRLRKEPVVEKWDNAQQQQIIQSNECVQDCANNRLQEQQQQYGNENKRVSQHIAAFKKWSDQNKNTKNKNQTFKFFYKKASPPQNILDSNYKQTQKQSNRKNQINKQLQKITSNFDFFNFGNQQFKYDFFQINQKRLQDYLDKQELKKNHQIQNEEQDVFLQAFRKFQKYKSLDSISTMDQYKMAEDSFLYNLNNNNKDPDPQIKLDSYFFNKFIYKSVVKSLKSTQKDIQYFRDIGLPSRNLDKFSQMMTKRGKLGKQSFQDQTKQQAHYLHLLRQGELNVNKNQIGFDDVSNISNGRITYLNAYLCIRSQKVTKAQYQKLLKRLDKYRKQQMQKGKQKIEVGVLTDDIEVENQLHQKLGYGQQKNLINQMISEISELRQATVLLKNKKNQNNLVIKQSIINKEKYVRMEYLLKRLYQSIITDPSKYPFTFLEDYMENVEDLLLSEYKDGKLLWFIIDCYEEIISNMPQQDNIKTVLKKKPINEPKISTYKGARLLREENLRATNLYSQNFRNKKQVPTNDRSGKTPTKPRTPIKSTTPIKTAVKKQNYVDASSFSKTLK